MLTVMRQLFATAMRQFSGRPLPLPNRRPTSPQCGRATRPFRWPVRHPLRRRHGLPDGSRAAAFSNLLKRAGFPKVRFYDMRHGHATQLFVQGVHPKVVSERRGHSSIGIALDTYSHVLPGLQEEAARKVDTVHRAALGE